MPYPILLRRSGFPGVSPFLRLLLPLLLSLPLQLHGQQMTKLEAFKFKLQALNVPGDLQEEWIEDLERYEDRQDSKAFTDALAESEQKLEKWLVGDIDAIIEEERKRKKGFLKKLRRDISGLAKNVTKNVGAAGLVEAAKIAERKGNYESAIEKYQLAIVEFESLGKWERAFEMGEQIAEIYTIMEDPGLAAEQLKQLKVKMLVEGETDGYLRLDEKILQLAPESVIIVKVPPRPELITPLVTEALPSIELPPSPPRRQSRKMWKRLGSKKRKLRRPKVRFQK